MGLEFLVADCHQLPQMNAIVCPAGVDEAAVRRALLSDYNIEIGAGLGPLAGKIWRIGLMGYSCRTENVMLCLGALEQVLTDQGMPVQPGRAQHAAHQVYSQPV
jgi:alanine-glyoxylate transaminase/serine-glyoxylate transaminase/serine-pyruvate transaminase